MILLMLHILLGIASIVLGVVALTKKSQNMLTAQIGSFAGTIISGIGLVVVNPSSLAHLCVSGTVFSAITIGLIVATRRRLVLTADRI